MTQFRTMGRLSAIAAAAMMVATTATSAFATDPTTSPSPTPTAQEKRICVQEAITGSRMARKVCKTRAEWIREEGYDPSQGSR